MKPPRDQQIALYYPVPWNASNPITPHPTEQEFAKNFAPLVDIALRTAYDHSSSSVYGLLIEDVPKVEGP
jgi:hypothetical protein